MRSFSLKPQRSRFGGVLVEAIVASALLLTATTSLTRFIVSSKQLEIAADQRLAAKLVTENVVERLRSIKAEAWPTKADAIAQDVSTESGIKTQIKMTSFQLGERDAWHATIRCQVGNNESAYQENHTWKVIQ